MDNKKIELDYMSDISSNITCIIEEMDLTKLSKTELLEKCKEYGITKCKTKKKDFLSPFCNEINQHIILKVFFLKENQASGKVRVPPIF